MDQKSSKDGGPAYPRPFSESSTHSYEGFAGMSLRDHFAGLAFAALIAKLPMIDREGEHGVSLTQPEIDKIRKQISESAYDYADAMLAARKLAPREVHE